MTAQSTSELRIDRTLLTRLARPAGARLLAATLCEWLMVVGAACLSIRLDSAWATAAAIMFIGTRQHALLVLMHEFSHRQLSRRRPRLNDAVGDILTAIPFMITLHGFRRDHQAHHQHTSTEGDPNWVSMRRQRRYHFSKTRPAFFLELIKHAVGLYTLRELKVYQLESRMSVACPRSTVVRQGLVASALLLVCAASGGWKVLATYWLLPMFTVLIALLYLRDVAEHFGLPREAASASRTTLARPWERLFLAPHNVGFHAEHHLYPSVPWFRLRALHEALSEAPAYPEQVVITRGYLDGLLDELAASSSGS